MKDTEKFQKSCELALGRSLCAAANIHAALLGIKSGGGRRVLMSLIRRDIAELTEQVNEYNAYADVAEKALAKEAK